MFHEKKGDKEQNFDVLYFLHVCVCVHPFCIRIVFFLFVCARMCGLGVGVGGVVEPPVACSIKLQPNLHIRELL